MPTAFNQFMTDLGRALVRDMSGVLTATGHRTRRSGFAFPFLMSLAGSRRHLSSPALLLLVLGAAAAAAWLALTAARTTREHCLSSL